jgi:CheY-like chemotaxis protein
VNRRQEPARQPALKDKGIVLLAEDNEITACMVTEYLQLEGYQVALARDGEEVLEKVEQTPPKIILMDVQMPKLDGLQATCLLREDPRFVSTPIIALTALAMPGDKERCLEAGTNAYLSKPVSLGVLLKTIKSLTEQGS